MNDVCAHDIHECDYVAGQKKNYQKDYKRIL